jgi:hypothetical protein
MALKLANASDAPSPIQLRDVTRETGITFVHTDGSSGQRYIVETVASGLAVFDYDNDGDVDIYFLNGAKLGNNPGVGAGTPVRAMRFGGNDGNWKFTDVTERSGLGDTNFSVGVATADYDNDGDQDVYISNFGPNKLYRNNGDGTFSDVTKKAGVEDGDKKIGAGVAFLDIDHDGDLDLFRRTLRRFHLRKPSRSPVQRPPRLRRSARLSSDAVFAFSKQWRWDVRRRQRRIRRGQLQRRGHGRDLLRC